MDAELRPRDDFAELLECPEAARHRDKPVGQCRHRCLALVHRVDDTQVGERAVGELARDERVRNDAYGVAAGVEDGIRDHAHQSDRAAAEDEADAAPHHFASKPFSRRGVLGPGACTRSAEHADTSQG